MDSHQLPLISILIPVYNAEKHLNRCIDSIINQTFTNYEVILINDGSTDKSGALCDKISKTDKRISVIHQPNGGPNKARNAGIENAKGEYLVFIDSDDMLYTNDTLEINIDFLLKDPDIDIVSFPQYREERNIIDGHSTFSTKKGQLLARIIEDKFTIFSNWYNGHLIDGMFPGKIFRKSLFDGWRLTEDIRFTEDHYNIPDICSRLNKVKISGIGGYAYMYNETSLIHSPYTTKKRRDQFMSQVRLLKYYNYLQHGHIDKVVYRNALENAFYLRNTEYGQKAIEEIKSLPRVLTFSSGGNTFVKMLSIATCCLGIEAGFNLMKSISRIFASLKKPKTI